MAKRLVALAAMVFLSCLAAVFSCAAGEDPELAYAGMVQKLFTSERFKELPGACVKQYVLLNVSPDGHFKVLGIGNEKLNEPVAKAALHRLLLSGVSFPPLIPQLNGKPYAWMCFSWDNTPKPTGQIHNTSCVSGPYFDDEIPQYVLYETGLKKRSYVDRMDRRILDARKLEGEMHGSAVVYMALDPKGVIKRISFSCSDKIYEKWLYDGIGKAQPFGELPIEYKKTPFFKTELQWEHSHSGGGGSSNTVHTKTYLGK